MHHHFAAGSLSRHNLVVFVFVFRARSNAITGHVLTLSRIKKGLVNPREGAENPLHELTKRTPREAAHNGMTAAGLGARSGAENAALALVFLFFFFFGNQDFQKTRRSNNSSKVHSISSTSPRPAERTLARGLHKSRADTTKSGTGRDRRAWSDPPDRAHRRRARPWKRDQTTSPRPALAAAWGRAKGDRGCCVRRNPRSSVFFTALSAGEVPDRSRDRHDA